MEFLVQSMIWKKQPVRPSRRLLGCAYCCGKLLKSTLGCVPFAWR